MSILFQSREKVKQIIFSFPISCMNSLHRFFSNRLKIKLIWIFQVGSKGSAFVSSRQNIVFSKYLKDLLGIFMCFIKMGFSTEYQGKFPLHCAVHRNSENFQSKNSLKVLPGNNGEDSAQKEFLLLLLSQNCLTSSKSISVSKLTWLGKTLQHSYLTKTDWKVSLCSLWLQP